MSSVLFTPRFMNNTRTLAKQVVFRSSVGQKCSISIDCAKNVLTLREIKRLNKIAPQYDYAKKKTLQWKLKRGADYALASLLFVASLPLIFLSALAVKLESKGPAFFIQKRVGKMGKQFSILKLRTMYIDLEKQGLTSGVNDSRITKVGKVLRKFSLDEFPQLINILKGDMTLIGPRAIQYSTFKHLAKDNPDAVRRFAVLPGAKIVYRGIKNYDSKSIIEIEKKYLDNWNLKNDIKNFVQIGKQIFSGQNG